MALAGTLGCTWDLFSPFSLVTSPNFRSDVVCLSRFFSQGLRQGQLQGSTGPETAETLRDNAFHQENVNHDAADTAGASGRTIPSANGCYPFFGTQ